MESRQSKVIRKNGGLSPIFLILLLILITAAVGIGSLFVGSVRLDVSEVLGILADALKGRKGENANLWNLIIRIRLPRILMTLLAGAILSVVGILMQTITRNPLAEPFVLGVSSGASTGAVGAIVLGWCSFMGNGKTFFAAFVGSFAAIVIVLLLQGRSASPVRLVLTGMGVSSFFQAATTLIVYSAQNESQSRSAMFWITGSFSGVSWKDLPLPLAAFLLLLLFCQIIGKELDLLLLGQTAAAQTGLNVRRLQLIVVAAASAAVAVIVAESGVIGFVGLIIPHIMRKFAGVKHRLLVLASALGGAAFLAAADSIARTVFAPREVPIGIMTSFVGAPIFILIIKRAYSEDRD
ncbi:MAG: iron ABC transporter permease [Eubacteriales bacterium]|nr:iron ABC transporter permease [Eubacteriales bacterium]